VGGHTGKAGDSDLTLAPPAGDSELAAQLERPPSGVADVPVVESRDRDETRTRPRDPPLAVVQDSTWIDGL
jgi:hypothetical protein